jgi:hypothetical protein
MRTLLPLNFAIVLITFLGGGGLSGVREPLVCPLLDFSYGVSFIWVSMLDWVRVARLDLD